MKVEDATVLEFPDEQQYWQIAQSLRDGHGMVDELGFRATRMPMYPGLLSFFAGYSNGIVMVKVLQWIIGAMTASLACLLATSIWNLRTGFVAGLLLAFDPFFIFFSSLLLTETLFILTFLLLWWEVWTMFGCDPRRIRIPHRQWIILGVVSGICIYVRESTAGIVVITVGLILAMHRFHPRSVLGSILCLLTVIICLSPWAYRNQKVTGHACWLTHRAGISLYDGVKPDATGESDLGDIKNMEAVQALNEVEWNQYFWDESMAIIKDDPVRIARLAGVKFVRMWNPLPNVETYQSLLIRTISVLWTLPTFLLALTGTYLLWCMNNQFNRKILLWLLLPALYYSAIHSLFIGSIRYRLGAIPMLEILAAFALVVLIEKIQTGHHNRDSSIDV